MTHGMICRMDRSGLGIQTRRLARMLKPNKIMLIDSQPFNKRAQYPRWYTDYSVSTVSGFPSDSQVRSFLSGLDTVISVETFYHNGFTEIARDMRVKTILIANPEFFDWFRVDWAYKPLPDKVVVPSMWKLDEMERLFDAEYIPTPIFDDEFLRFGPDDNNKYLFINGISAAEDRNGLESLYEALHHSKGQFTITVKSQSDIKRHPDPRIEYDFSNPEDPSGLYRGYDALILPRRYGGQSLPMTEALFCGLPVVMTDVDPNNKVLPKEWLVPVYKTTEMMTRTLVDVYSADPIKLAEVLDRGFNKKDKAKALELGQQYEAERLRSNYEELLND